MIFALALASLLAAPATFETYVVTLTSDAKVALTVNGVRVEEPLGRRVPIEHFVVPGPNTVVIEPLSSKTVGQLGEVRLVLGKSDSRSWETADGQVIAKLTRGASVFSVPQALRPPLWRIGQTVTESNVTLRAKVASLHALLVGKTLDKYLAQFAESYDETERLFPMVKAATLRDRDEKALETAVKKGTVAPLADDIVCTPEADQRLVVCARKGTRVTFEVGGEPVLIKLMKMDGALRPYVAFRP